MIAWELIKRVAPGLILGALVIAALLLAYHGGQRETEQRLGMAHSLELASMRADAASAAASAARKARDDKQAADDAMAALANDFHAKEAHAKAELERLDAAVRAGDVRLRTRFSCTFPAPGDGGKQAASTTPSSDAAQGRGFGEADARAAVRIADEGDDAIRALSACQAIVQRDRGTK